MTLRRILEAPIADLTFEDVETLIQEEAEEGPRFELKRELPANDRQGDPWMQGGRKLGDRARDGLAKEVVALANAYGGAVVIGVDESDEEPKRAVGPEPLLIPRIAECAERLQKSLDSIIDPPLPVLEVRGIVKPDADGSGVLVIRTGASTRAPHGYGRPPAAYMRRGSRSEPMSMRDLQSVLFETRSRGERISGLLDQRRTALMRMIQKGAMATAGSDGPRLDSRSKVIWFRCSSVAAEDINLRVFDIIRDGWFIRPRTEYTLFGDGHFHNGWHPQLGGIVSRDYGSRHFSHWFVGDQGVIDAYGFLVLDTYRNRDDVFPPVLFPSVAVQVLGMGERLRQAAGRPEVELVIECEFINPGTASAIYGDGRPFDTGTEIPEGSTRIGPFSLGNIDDFPSVYAEIERSLWHGLGLPIGARTKFPMAEWLAELARS